MAEAVSPEQFDNRAPIRLEEAVDRIWGRDWAYRNLYLFRAESCAKTQSRIDAAKNDLEKNPEKRTIHLFRLDLAFLRASEMSCGKILVEDQHLIYWAYGLDLPIPIKKFNQDSPPPNPALCNARMKLAYWTLDKAIEWLFGKVWLCYGKDDRFLHQMGFQQAILMVGDHYSRYKQQQIAAGEIPGDEKSFRTFWSPESRLVKRAIDAGDIKSTGETDGIPNVRPTSIVEWYLEQGFPRRAWMDDSLCRPSVKAKETANKESRTTKRENSPGRKRIYSDEVLDRLRSQFNCYRNEGGKNSISEWVKECFSDLPNFIRDHKEVAKPDYDREDRIQAAIPLVQKALNSAGKRKR